VRYNQLKLFFPYVIILLVFIVNLHTVEINAMGRKRILEIKPRIISKHYNIKLLDLVLNPNILSDYEKNLEVIKVSTYKNEEKISLITLAYSMQQYPELVNVYLRGPDQITIQNSLKDFYLAKAKQGLFEYISKTPPWIDWKVDVSFETDDEKIITSVGHFNYIHVQAINNRAMLGNVSFRVAYFDNHNSLIEENTISPIIKRELEVVVLTNNLTRNHIITDANIQTMPILVGSEKHSYLTDKKNCIDKELNRKLSAGSLLRLEYLRNPIQAERGDIIWVTYQSKSLSIRITAKAMETGRRGETIKAKNLSSKKIINVELIGSKQAIVNL